MTTGTTIVGARVFDGREVQAETSVRFVGGLVTACAARDVTRNGDEVVDGTGRTLLPGLIDAHTHLLPGAPQQACTFGVTTELDMFSQPDLVRRCKAEAAARLDVADVRSSGIGATAPGGHPSMMYTPFPTVTGPDDAEGFVADRIAEGSDYLKIIYEPGDGRLFTLPSLDFARCERSRVQRTTEGWWSSSTRPPWRRSPVWQTPPSTSSPTSPSTLCSTTSSSAASRRRASLSPRPWPPTGARADLALVDGDPLNDITHSRRITRVWRGGVPCDRSAFVGSAAEDEQFDALHAQVEKVMAAAREFFPDAGQLPDAG